MDTFMEFTKDISVTISLWELIIFLTAGIAFLLFGRHKVGLSVSLIFMLYLVFITNRSTFIEAMGNNAGYIFLYIFLGVVVLFLAVLGFFVESK